MFDVARDHLALYIGYTGLGQVALMRGKLDAVLDASEKAVGHAHRAGLPYHLLDWRASARVFGSTPVVDLLGWLDTQDARGVQNVDLRRYKSLALAMLGRFDEARAIMGRARADLADRGSLIRLAAFTCSICVDVGLMAGDSAAAVALGEEGCRMLDELGEGSFLSTGAGNLAQALYAADRLEEAAEWAGRAKELGASDDAATQMLWRQVRAKVHARCGQRDEAERLAREAVAISEDTDLLNEQAKVYADLGEVLSLVGRSDEAVAALEEALARYERKGNLVSTERTKKRIAEIRAKARTSGR